MAKRQARILSKADPSDKGSNTQLARRRMPKGNISDAAKKRAAKDARHDRLRELIKKIEKLHKKELEKQKRDRKRKK